MSRLCSLNSPEREVRHVEGVVEKFEDVLDKNGDRGRAEYARFLLEGREESFWMKTPYKNGNPKLFDVFKPGQKVRLYDSGDWHGKYFVEIVGAEILSEGGNVLEQRCLTGYEFKQ